MSDNTAARRRELEDELARYQIDLVANQETYHAIQVGLLGTQAEIMQLEMEEKAEQDLKDQGNAEADQLIADAEQSRAPQTLEELLEDVRYNHPAGKSPRRSVEEYADLRLQELHEDLKSVGAGIYGVGPKPQTLEGLAEAVRQRRAMLVVNQ